MNTGILGGTFNPIHNGHISLAEHFLQLTDVDEVWFMVTPQNPWKRDSQLADDNLRLEMVSRALEGHDRLHASDYEFHLDRPSYSYITLRHLRADYPEHVFTLLIGADNWVKFDQWANHEEILRHHNVAVYPRRHCHVDTDTLPDNVVFVDMPLLDISSTDIRQMLREGKDVAAYVPENIEATVKKAYPKTKDSGKP